MKGVVLGHTPVVVERPAVPASNRDQDALFSARAALKRAYSVWQAAELQVDQMRALVERLEGRRRVAG